MTTKKKAILLVRVSTENQDFEEQDKEIDQMAKNDGYAEKDIAHIAEKESGRQLSEDERKGLNRMKKLISTGEYDCVYAWEVSRIARTKKVLFSIVEYLVKNHIQLVIKEPNIRLLKNDYTIDEGAETIFTLYAQLAETEMRNKLARFSRAKKEYFEKGRYMGGKITLGYYVDENGYWRVDENDRMHNGGAKLIREIFDLYNTGEYSMTELASELISRGYFHNVSTTTNVKCELSRILKSEIYRGIRKNNNVYPRIIDDVTWEKTVQRRLENKKMGRKSAQRLLSAKIRCKCGASYSANLLDCCYTCRVRHNYVERGIEHSPSININVAESLAWYVTLSELEEDMIKNKGVAKAEYEQKISCLNQKVAVAQDYIDKAITRRSKLDEDFYVKQRLDEKRYNTLTEGINKKIDESRMDILAYKSQIKDYERLVRVEMTFDETLNKLSKKYDELKQGTNMELMRELVKRYIKEIHIEPLPQGYMANYQKKVVFITYRDQMEMEQRQKKMRELGIDGLDFINQHTYYVDTQYRKAYFDEQMTNEVPMFYMELAERRRRDHRRIVNGKRVYVRNYVKRPSKK